MTVRLCQQKGCHSWRNRRALWLWDRVPTCMQCYEKKVEAFGIDGHSIHRLSDCEDDFERKLPTPRQPVAL